MHACLQMKKYADVISEGLNFKKQSLCFTLKWFPICFPFLFFVMLAREIKKKQQQQQKQKTKNKEKNEKRGNLKLKEGSIIKRGPHCIFHHMERQVQCFFSADKIGQLNIKKG